MQATPVVRRIARELGVELQSLAGSAPGGRITEEDVRAAAAAASGEGRREPLRGVRRLIAEHMARAHREVPPVTWTVPSAPISIDCAGGTAMGLPLSSSTARPPAVTSWPFGVTLSSPLRV